MKRAQAKMSNISKLCFSVLVACLIAVPALMGTVFVNTFNGNLVAFAADLEASPQSLSEAKAALDAAKQNQEAASTQHDKAKNAYDSSTADYNAAVSEHAVAQKASDEAKNAAEQEFAAAKSNAVAKAEAAQQNLTAANQKKAALEVTLKEQEKAVQDAQKAYDDAVASSPEEVKSAAEKVQAGEKQQEIDAARVTKAQERVEVARKELEAAKTYEKNAKDRLDAATKKEEAAQTAMNKAQEAYDKALAALLNAGEDPFESVDQAWENAKTQVTKAENDLDKANQELIAARNKFGTAQEETRNAKAKLGARMEELCVYSGKEYQPGMEEQETPEYVEVIYVTYSDSIAPMSSSLEEKQQALEEALNNKTKAQEAYNAATKAANDAATEYNNAQAALQAIQDVYGENSPEGIMERAQARVNTAQGVKEAADLALKSAETTKAKFDKDYTDALNTRNQASLLYQENLTYFTGLLAEKESEILAAFPSGTDTYSAWHQLKTEYSSFSQDATIELSALTEIDQANTKAQTIRYNELKPANEAFQDAQAIKDNLSTLVQQRSDLKTVAEVASTAHTTASSEKATAQTDSNTASQDLATKQKAVEDLEQEQKDAEDALALTEASLVALREDYKTSLETYGADNAKAIEAASTSLDTAQKNKRATSAELEGMKTTISTAEENLKEASGLSDRLKMLSFAAALSAPIVEPGYEYLNNFVEKYRSLQAPLAAAAERMNAARVTVANNKLVYDDAAKNLNRASTAVAAARADYDRFVAESNGGNNKKPAANKKVSTMKENAKEDMIDSAENTTAESTDEGIAVKASTGATKASAKNVSSNGIDPLVIVVGSMIALAAVVSISAAIIRSRRTKA